MIMAYISIFIGLAVMLGIGTLILSGSVMDCQQISDYDSNATTQSGWSLSCENVNEQSQSSYSLLIVVLIVVSAIIILSILRILGWKDHLNQVDRYNLPYLTFKFNGKNPKDLPRGRARRSRISHKVATSKQAWFFRIFF